MDDRFFISSSEALCFVACFVGATPERSTIDRGRLTDRVGSLGSARVRDVLGGLALLFGIE